MRDGFERIDDLEEVFVFKRRPAIRCYVKPARLRQGLSAPYLSGEPAPTQRTPGDRADSLIEAEGHELPFVIPADEGIISLIGDISRKAISVRGGQGLHEMPARKVGHPSVANLSLANE